MRKSLYSLLASGRNRVFTTKERLICCFLIIVAVIILIFNIAFSKLYSDNIRKIIVKEAQDSLQRTCEHIDLIIKNVQNISDIIMNDSNIQNELDSQHYNEGINYRRYLQIIQSLQSIEYVEEGITSIDLYFDEKEVVVTTDYGLLSNLSHETVKYLKELKNSDEEVSLTDSYIKGMDTISGRNYEQITFIRPVYAFSTGTKEGILCINMDKYTLRNILKSKNNTGHMILSEEGKPIIYDFPEADFEISMVKEKIKLLRQNKKGAIFEKHAGNEYAFVYDTSEYTGWKFVSIVPMSLFVKQRLQLRDTIFLLFVALNLASVLIAILLISETIYRKLEKLILGMREVESGNLDVTIGHKGNDEFSYIYTRFNEMVNRIKALFDQLLQQRLLQKDAELKLLQSKINPHFIYNIFDNMNWLIQLERYEELEDLVDAVSTYYKRVNNAGRDDITVSDTVEQLQSYVDIQLIRFKDKFECTFDIEPDLMDMLIPNFILQPLVENAIGHGIEPKIGKGKIVVKGWQEGNDVFFSVEDDGVGIEKERLIKIQRLLEREVVETDNCFALANINKRIKLYYGKEYGLKIDSEAGVGTRVVLSISKQANKLGGYKYAKDVNCG